MRSDVRPPQQAVGKCCFEGLGTPQNYAKAKTFLEQVNWDNSDTYYMLGCIYGRGLDTAEDIPKGVAYLKKAGDNKKAQEAVLSFEERRLADEEGAGEVSEKGVGGY